MNRSYIVPALAIMSCLVFFSTSAAQEIVPYIIGGELTDEFPSVGTVGSQRYGDFCSGILISPYHVLTAGHCGAYIEGPSRGTFTVGGETYATSNVYIHPEYDDAVLSNDIAILELSEPVLGIEPSRIFYGVPEVGDALIIVGYGAGGEPVSGSDGTFGAKRMGTTIIDQVTDTLIIWEFDDENESNTAPGDSGGPGYIEVAGELFIACITSGGTQADASLGDSAFNTRVDAYADWIDSIIDAFDDDEDIPVDQPTDSGCKPGNHGRPPHSVKPGHGLRPPHGGKPGNHGRPPHSVKPGHGPRPPHGGKPGPGQGGLHRPGSANRWPGNVFSTSNGYSNTRATTRGLKSCRPLKSRSNATY